MWIWHNYGNAALRLNFFRQQNKVFCLCNITCTTHNLSFVRIIVILIVDHDSSLRSSATPILLLIEVITENIFRGNVFILVWLKISASISSFISPINIWNSREHYFCSDSIQTDIWIFIFLAFAMTDKNPDLVKVLKR